MQLRFRIAPTPSGYLHIGNAFNFVLTARVAEQLGGELLLRIDDLDEERVRQDYMDDIFESLEWLGLAVQTQGPGPTACVRQSEHLHLYNAVIQQFFEADLLFACTCTRSQLLARNSQLIYDGHCLARGKPLDTPDAALRIKDADAPLPYSVIRQKNGRPAYMMASIVDDVDMGITHIVRGEDLRNTTRTQLRILASAPFSSLPLPSAPFRFHHHPLIVDDRGEKLSKSAGASSLKSLRMRGESAQHIHEMVNTYLATHGDLFSPDE